MVEAKGNAALILLGVLVTIVLLSAPRAWAQEPLIHGRSFDRFQFDPVVNRGLWGEGRVSYARQENDGSAGDVDVLMASPRVAYGWRFIEGGLIVPSIYLHSDQSSDESGLGDIHLYGKVLPLDTEVVRAGLGLDVSIPSGDEDKGLGTGEGGFTPFATAAARGGPVDVRGHVGYQAFTGSASDSVVFGVGAFVNFAAIAIGRLELIGQHYDFSGPSTTLALEPGVDFRIPVRRVDLWLRATGAAGLTDETADWGMGFGIAVSWDPAGR